MFERCYVIKTKLKSKGRKGTANIDKFCLKVIEVPNKNAFQ